MLIASGVRVLAWLKKEERKKGKEQNCVLAGCRFVILALLMGDFSSLVSKGSTQKGQESDSKYITLGSSRVIVV